MYRGIPSGYISSLEQRLLETEAALFDALALTELSNLGNEAENAQMSAQNSLQSLAEHSNSLSREAKVDEWKRVSLAPAANRQIWLQEKLRIVRKRGGRGEGSSDEENPRSHQMEHPWPASSYIQQIGEGVKSGEGNSHFNYENPYLDIPASKDLSDQAKPNVTSPQQIDNGTIGLNGEAESPYDLDGMMDNSHILEGQHLSKLHTPQSSAGMGHLPSLVESHQPPRAANSTHKSQETRQQSLEQWQRYF